MRKKHGRTRRFTLHGVLAGVAVVSIVLIEEGCSIETDFAGPGYGPPRMAETPTFAVDLFDESRFDHPMYDLPTGPKDFNDQLAAAAALIPGGFGGAYKHRSGQTVVYITDMTKSGGALNSLMGLQPSGAKSYHRAERGDVVFVQGAYDWRDLNAWYKLALRECRDGVVLMDIDERTNKLWIGVSNTGIESSLRRDLETAGIPTGAVEVGYRAPIEPAWGPPAATSTAQAMTLQSNFDPPYYSGIQHGGTGIPLNGTCTMGAIVNLTNGGTGYLTASHCTDVIFRDDGNDHFQPTTSARSLTISATSRDTSRIASPLSGAG